MIIQKPTEGFEGKLIHTLSDKGFKIKQAETGIIYDEADDIIPCPYTYIEAEEEKNEEFN